jgi:DNA-binding transcriptional ArsR family regulator
LKGIKESNGITATHAAELFQALSDPTRVRIVGLLAHTELCVGDLCLVLGMSRPAVSHHLRLLRTLRMSRRARMGNTSSIPWSTSIFTSFITKVWIMSAMNSLFFCFETSTFVYVLIRLR